jgi:hypothetical protein
MMNSIAPKSGVLTSIVSAAAQNKNNKAKRLMKPKPQDVTSNQHEGNPRLNFIKKVKLGPGQNG